MALTAPFSNTKKIGKDESYTDIDSGPFIAIVKDNVDATYMGRLKVVIPALNKGKEAFESELITVQYLPPFYGAKSPDSVNETDIANFVSSQHSYGMWMVPPDIDTKVLVIFVEGKISEGYWIGCVQEPFINHMTPGIASSTNTFSPVIGDTDVTDKNASYGTDNLPAGEVNRGQFKTLRTAGFDKLGKPIHPFAETLKNQGLVQDDVRGNTTSSARRETPSNVFGISTPGPIDQRSTKIDSLGPKDKSKKIKTTRKAGHTFVMDDGDIQGQNQLIRLRTSSGHQLLMNDSAGVVYLANSEGTVWMEFSNNGMVDVYAQTGYNLRSGADINFHAEGNINMYANKNVRIKANEDSGTNESKGSVSIDGANIKQFATENIRQQGNNIFTKAIKNITGDAGAKNIQQGINRVDLIGGQVHFNNYPTINNLVDPMSRTSFSQPYGTGTKLDNYPDVTLQPLGNIYKIDRALPSLSGMRVPTHEPFWGHQDNAPAFGSVGGTNTTVGTAGWIENQNRNADLMSIKWAQYREDLNAELNKNPNGSVTSLTSVFNAGYSKKYSVDNNFLTANVDGYLNLGQGAYETYNNLSSKITNNSNDNLTSVLINEAGVLYTKNANQIIRNTVTNKVTGNLNKTVNTVNKVGVLLSDQQVTNTVQGIVPGLRTTTNTYNNLSKVTETYKNVVGGKVTAVTQVNSAVSTFSNSVVKKVGSVAKSIGKVFGF